MGLFILGVAIKPWLPSAFNLNPLLERSLCLYTVFPFPFPNHFLNEFSIISIGENKLQDSAFADIKGPTVTKHSF